MNIEDQLFESQFRDVVAITFGQTSEEILPVLHLLEMMKETTSSDTLKEACMEKIREGSRLLEAL